jgi:hypothetical protein
VTSLNTNNGNIFAGSGNLTAGNLTVGTGLFNNSNGTSIESNGSMKFKGIADKNCIRFNDNNGGLGPPITDRSGLRINFWGDSNGT